MDTQLEQIYDKICDIEPDFEMPDEVTSLLEWATSVGVIDIVLDMIRQRRDWKSIYMFVYNQEQDFYFANK